MATNSVLQPISTDLVSRETSSLFQEDVAYKAAFTPDTLARKQVVSTCILVAVYLYPVLASS